MVLPHHKEEFQKHSYSHLRFTGVHMPAAYLHVKCMPSYRQFTLKYDTHNNKIYTVILKVPICFVVLCYHIQQSSESAIPVFFMCNLKFCLHESNQWCRA